jgi:hypothetical protein
MSIESRAKALMRQLGRSKQASPPDKLYRIGEHEIMLKGQHELPLHQLHHRLYDRFPISLGLAHGDGWIVDISANVGDSAAAFASGSPKQILCIEPVAHFYSLLCRAPASGWGKHYLREHPRWPRGNRRTHLGKSNHRFHLDRRGKHVLHDPG